MNNEEAKIHLQSAKLMLLGADGQPVSDLYYAVEKGIEALETIPKYKDAYNKGWDDGAKATYEHLKMCEEEQEPCEDCISRQAVINVISNFILEIHTESGRDLNAHTNEVLRQILRNINSDEVLPSVNPQEQTGHWIAIDEEPHEDYECDKCGYTISTYTANIEPHTEYKYCPNCGAKMFEPQERSEKE